MERLQSNYSLKFQVNADSNSFQFPLLKQFSPNLEINNQQDLFDYEPAFRFLQQDADKFIIFKINFRTNKIEMYVQDRFISRFRGKYFKDGDVDEYDFDFDENDDENDMSWMSKVILSFVRCQFINSDIYDTLISSSKPIYIKILARDRVRGNIRNYDYHTDHNLFQCITLKNMHKEYVFGTGFILNAEKIRRELSSNENVRLIKEYAEALNGIHQLLTQKPQESRLLRHIIKNYTSIVWADAIWAHAIPYDLTSTEPIKEIDIVFKKQDGVNLVYIRSSMKVCTSLQRMDETDFDRRSIILSYVILEPDLTKYRLLNVIGIHKREYIDIPDIVLTYNTTGIPETDSKKSNKFSNQAEAEEIVSSSQLDISYTDLQIEDDFKTPSKGYLGSTESLPESNAFDALEFLEVLNMDEEGCMVINNQRIISSGGKNLKKYKRRQRHTKITCKKRIKKRHMRPKVIKISRRKKSK
jgi:hypothetical protein